jgi:Protein of unknown function (DUF4231)
VDATSEPLTIGVTGHRPARLAGVDMAVLAERVRATLASFATAAGEGRPLRMVSSLAEGADSIAADAALALGWTLDVVLPFERNRNAEDFPDAAPRAALDERLARARSIFALSGEALAGETAAASYERAGRVMLAQSDVLLAVWDGDPARGRGGAAQIVAEAVQQGIPVIHVPVSMSDDTPELLWDRLDDHDLGQQSLETVPRGRLDQLPRLIAHLVAGAAGSAALDPPRRNRPTIAVAYAALLAATGVRGLRRSDFVRARPEDSRDELLATCGAAQGPNPFATRLSGLLAPRYGEADAGATEAARRFRSAYVSNFALAALAVVTSLIGLALPKSAKPVLICLEIAIIAAILIITHLGNKSGWHRRWLKGRQVAEQLRCLAICAQIGDLRLRASPHAATRDVARRLGLPDATVDRGYIARVQADLTALIDSQIAYLDSDACRMHRLEHRLHRLGGFLFAATATICFLYLGAEIAMFANPEWHEHIVPVMIWGTILSAALPAIGAAIYGIRMQGDFAGTGERNTALADQLRRVKAIGGEQPHSYDVLWRRATRTADLLIEDLSDWLRTYTARPLALPG